MYVGSLLNFFLHALQYVSTASGFLKEIAAAGLVAVACGEISVAMETDSFGKSYGSILFRG